MTDEPTSTSRFDDRAAEFSPPSAPVVFLTGLVWTLTVHVPSLHVAEGDAAFFDAVATMWRHGHLPYRDAFDVKPPGIFALAALAQTIFGPGLASLKAVAIVSDALTSFGLWRIGRRLDAPGAGLFAALLFPALAVFVISNTAYSALAALTTLAFAAALSTASLRRRAALAGLVIGAACCVKQTAAFEAFALIAVLIGGAQGRGARLGVAAAFGFGASLAPLAFLAYFAAQGAAGDLLQATVGAAFSRSHSPLENLTLLDGVARTPRMLSGVFPLLIGAALAFLHRDRVLRDPRAARLLFGWLAAAFVSLLAQRAVTTLYVTPLIAPALLLTGLAVTRLPMRPVWLARSAPLSMAALALVLAATHPAERNPAPLSLAGEARAAELILAQNPAPTDRLFVVNHTMWLYSSAGLAPPTPYFFPLITLCELLPGGGERLNEIIETKPRFVAIGDTSWGSVCERPERWALVKKWIARDYRTVGAPDEAPGGYTIYERTAARLQP